MAAAGRKPHARLTERLLAEPETFELFTAVRMIEEEAARGAAARREAAPPEVGSQDAAAGRGDPVRFRAAVTLGFPGGALLGARPLPAGDGPQSVVELDSASFGLVGPVGVLPRHYTVLVLERIRRFRDHSLRDFLDIFTHRATSLLVRAWAKYRLAVQRGRLASRGLGAAWDDAARPRDSVAAVLAALVGAGTRSLADRMRVGDELLLHYAGHLSRQTAAVVPLEQMIADAWAVPVHIEQFVGRWLALEPADQTMLSGRPAAGAGCNAVLGVTALAGRRVWSVESTFCVRLGPMSLAQFRRWLPEGALLGGLSDLLRYSVGPHLEATVRPLLLADEVPQAQLGGQERLPDGSPGGCRLGWTSWLTSRRPVRDVDDACFEVKP